MTNENYNLKLIYKSDGAHSFELSPNNPYKKEALKKDRRKIYIIHDTIDVLYVGEANVSLQTRFRRGTYSYNASFRKDIPKQPYKGYQWLDRVKNPSRELKVEVIIFSEILDNNRKEIEAIEGELVFLIRKELGYWPKFQQEIHFSNSDSAKEKALKIFDTILKLSVIKTEKAYEQENHSS